MVIPGTDIALPRGRSERERLVLEPENNIALGCRELRFNRENYVEDHPDEEDIHWLDWIGRYNSGRDGNVGYTRRVALQYRKLCDIEVETDEGLVPLREVWEGCETVDEYLSE